VKKFRALYEIPALITKFAWTHQWFSPDPINSVCSIFDMRTFQYWWRFSIMECKVMVKCTLVQALSLCTGRTARRGSRGIALPFNDHGTRREWGVSVTPRPLFTPGKNPVPIVQEAGWARGPVWTGAENFASTWTRSPERPAGSKSLYRLRYPAHNGMYHSVNWYLYTYIYIYNPKFRGNILKIKQVFSFETLLFAAVPLVISLTTFIIHVNSMSVLY
jgi:hypothetical protein